MPQSRTPMNSYSTRRARLSIALFAAIPILSILTPALFDAPVIDAVLGLGYELVLIAVPGWLLYGALVPTERSAFRHLAVAWPIGVAIELFAFAVTAAFDLRPLLIPTIVVIAALALSRSGARRRAAANLRNLITAVKELRPVSVALFDLLFAVILAVLAGQYYATQPLPETVGSVLYYVDVPWHWGFIGEMLHHWPATDPNIAGDPLHYHYFSHMHMAAVSQATGLDPSVLLLRIFPIAPLLSTMVLLCMLASALGVRLSVGLVAIVLVFLAGELDFDAFQRALFGGGFVWAIWFSPSFGFGVPFFLAGVALILRLWDRNAGSALGGACALAIVLMVAGGAKTTILPVLGLGLGIYLVWMLIRRHRLSRIAAAPLGLVLGAFAVTYALIYAGAPAGLELYGAAFVHDTTWGLAVNLPDRLLLAIPSLLLMMPYLVGITSLVLRREPLSEGHKLLLALLAAGVIYALTLSDPSLNELYFTYYGFVAGALLSAIGLMDLSSRLRERSAWPLAAVGIGVAVVSCGSALVVTALGSEPLGRGSVFTITGVIAGVLLFAAVVSALVRRDLGAFALAAVLIPAAVAASMFELVGDVALTRARGPAYETPTSSSKGLTSEIYAGLLWIRRNTSSDAVLAVSNEEVSPGNARYFLYSAISERRTFLGGWQYSERIPSGTEFSASILPTASILSRQRATMGILTASSCKELRKALLSAQADYALYDRVNSPQPEKLSAIGPPVFENSGIAVYDLRELSVCS